MALLNLKQYVKPYIKALPLDERYLLKQRVDDTIFSVEINSFPKLFFRKNSTDTRVFNQIFYWKEYDFIDVKYIPDTVIDCGANIGMFAIWAARRYPNAKIVSVEPSTANFEMLKRNTQQLKNATLLNKGIWNKTTDLEIIDTGDGEWQFHTVEIPAPTPTSVSAITIDDIMKQHGMNEIGLLKIDIESAEKELFENDTDAWLPKVKVMVIELHDRMKDGCTKALFRALDKYDYKMEISGENLVIFFKR